MKQLDLFETGLVGGGKFSLSEPAHHDMLIEELTNVLNKYLPSRQGGSKHYHNQVIQPLEYALINKLDAGQTKVVKYVTRHQFKNGRDDLLKARQCVDALLDFYYGGA